MAARRLSQTYPRKWSPKIVPTWPVEFDDGHPLSQGLQALYVPGQGYADLTGNAPAGTPVGGPQVVSSPIGPAWSFNGSGQYISIPDAPAFHTENWTIFSIATNAVASSAGTFFGKWFDPNSGHRGFYLNSTNDLITLNAPDSGGGDGSTFTSYRQSAVNMRAGAVASFDATTGTIVLRMSDGSSNTLASETGTYFTTNNVPMGIGADFDNFSFKNFYNGLVHVASVYDQPLSADYSAWLLEEPFAMLPPIVRRSYYAASASIPANAFPGASTLTLTGKAPTVSAGANVAPGSGALVLSGKAPTVSAGATVSPATAALILTGKAPTVSAGASVTPGSGALILAGKAPSVSAGASSTPGLGSLILAGLPPTVSAGATVSPGTSVLTLHGFAPTVIGGIGVTVTPGVGQLGLSGLAPTVSAGASAFPGAGALTLQGYPPTVTGGGALTPAPSERTVYMTWQSRITTLSWERQPTPLSWPSRQITLRWRRGITPYSVEVS